MAQQGTGGGQTDWKNKYINALDEQEKREHKQEQLTSLLMRAIVRISRVAEGVDQSLDKQLAGLRQMLRDGRPSAKDLNLMVDALEGQVKRIDTVKSERAKVIAQAFASLVQQLQYLGPEKADHQQLKQLQKSLKGRAGKIQEYSALINDYAKVQQSILQECGELRISKPFWHVWAANSDAASAGKATTVKSEATSSPPKPPSHDGPVAVKTEGLDLANDDEAPRLAINPESVGEEPPFSRLNQAVCEVLSELLEQIEPPYMAKDNYQAAQNQIAKGLNWYELVPVLEDISIVVVSAFDDHQQDFEKFLSQLNKKLTDAYQLIQVSKSVNEEGVDANRQLRESMQQQVSAMQESVASASELQQLKHEVSQRLDQIVAAMDHHASGDLQRQLSLADQLDVLVERVKSMEAASADAEQRIEEQRQKSLRDVLTQLPNREAYQQRLEQECDRWQRYQRPLTLAVSDIDHFKRINDNYGHLAGDKVLRIIARTLKKRLRKTDFIARYGGEEFVVLMPETTEAAALKVVEGVREAIASCPFHFKEKPVSITMSFGVAEFKQGDLAEGVFYRADKALYQAKERGRNRCVVAEWPPITKPEA